MSPNRERLAQILTKYLGRQDRSASWLAKQLGVAPSTVMRWQEGITYPRDPAHFRAMISLLRIEEKSDRDFLLGAAEYVASHPEASASLSSPSVPGEAPASPAAPSGTAWRTTLGRAFRQVVAQGEGWEVRALHLLRAGIEQMSAVRLLLALLPLTAWWLTNRLLPPLLRWPLAEAGLSQTASVKFGVATWLIPLLVTLFLILQSPDTEGSSPQSRPARRLFQLTGALVGFVSVALLGVGVGLAWYYVRGASLPRGVGWGLALFPLLASYVAGRGVPALRSRAEQGLQFGKGDALILLVFLLLGPAAAFFFYSQRPLLQAQPFGFLLLLALLAWTVWAARERFPKPLLVLLLGGCLPALALCLPLWMPGIPGAPTIHPPTLLLFTGYIVGQCLLIVTLYVHGRAKMLGPVLVFLLLMELLTLLVLTYDPVWGLRFLLGLGALMLVVGWLGQRPGLHSYLHMHASFWVMQLVFGVSLWAWGTVLGWTSLVFFSGATAGLLLWAGGIRLTPAALGRGRLSVG